MYGYRTNEDGTETLAWSITEAGAVICIHNAAKVCADCVQADERVAALVGA